MSNVISGWDGPDVREERHQHECTVDVLLLDFNLLFEVNCDYLVYILDRTTSPIECAGIS